MAVSQDLMSSGCLSAQEKPEKDHGHDILASYLVLKIVWLTMLCWDTTESKFRFCKTISFQCAD